MQLSSPEKLNAVRLYSQGVYGGGYQEKTSGTLHLFNVTLEDDGIYVCVTHNPLLNISKRSRPAKLNVIGKFLLCFGFFLVPEFSFLGNIFSQSH